jgi:hypothetical protein
LIEVLTSGKGVCGTDKDPREKYSPPGGGVWMSDALGDQPMAD